MEITDTLLKEIRSEEFLLTGKGHMERNEACQDVALRIETPECCFYGLADGQSGKKHSQMGGRVALKFIVEYLRDKSIAQLKTRYIDEIQYEIMHMIRNYFTDLAAIMREDISEFSSTIVAVAVDPRTGEYVCFHLGDGGIIGRKTDGSVDWISTPENGLSARYTWLTTSMQALTHFRVTFGSILCYNRILMLTDGASAISYGRNIFDEAAVQIRSARNPAKIAELVKADEPSDDAGIIVIDWDTENA